MVTKRSVHKTGWRACQHYTDGHTIQTTHATQNYLPSLHPRDPAADCTSAFIVRHPTESMDARLDLHTQSIEVIPQNNATLVALATPLLSGYRRTCPPPPSPVVATPSYPMTQPHNQERHPGYFFSSPHFPACYGRYHA